MIYLITNRLALRRKPSDLETTLCARQLELIAQAVPLTPAGHLLIQIREKDLTARALVDFTRAAVRIAHPHGARVLVNDRLDVALAAGADGVHLPTTSLPLPMVRAIFQQRAPQNLIGVSTHSLAEAQAAQQNGADFIVCGPVYPTPSKLAYGAPLGLAHFAKICQTVAPFPVLALGGINETNLCATLAHGASGIAGIRLFQVFQRPAKLRPLIHLIQPNGAA